MSYSQYRQTDHLNKRRMSIFPFLPSLILKVRLAEINKETFFKWTTITLVFFTKQMNEIDKINSSFSINTEKLIFTCLHLCVCVYV